jgi:sulfotransferase
MKKIYFLSGLPRSGSTVLAALLQQHSEMHTTATSGLLDMLVGTLEAWAGSLSQKSSTKDKAAQEKEIQRILKSICETKYADIDKPVILDKARGWASDVNMPTMYNVLGYKPKIIATVRNVEDCVASMVRVAKPDNLTEFLRHSDLVDHVKQSYQTLLRAHNFGPECIHYVEYEDLVSKPEEVLRGVEEFLELTPHTYDLNNIDASNLQEKDEEVWEVKGLHNVRKKLKKADTLSAEDTLEHMYRGFVQPRFWRGEQTSNLPVHKLDIMLSQGLMGNLDEAAKIGDELGFREPLNDRAAFNRGWYEIRRGNLLDGHKLIFRGRHESVFGNPPPRVPTPMWDGVSKGTILLNMEGGLGDQIHCAGMIRYMVKRGCDVIVACSGSLATLFRDMPGVRAVVQQEAAFGIVHDFWVPAMSAVLPLQLQYADVDGSAYISKPEMPKNKKFRIGLRWQGNPQFEHEQHRQFDPNLLFDAVKGTDAEFISLQRDEGAQYKPNWVKDVTVRPLGRYPHGCSVVRPCGNIMHISGPPVGGYGR